MTRFKTSRTISKTFEIQHEPRLIPFHATFYAL